MRTFTKGLLASVAAIALTSGAAIAQDNGLLGDTLNDVTDAVDADVVDDVTSTLDDTLDTNGDANVVDDVTSTVEDTVNTDTVTDTVDDVTTSVEDTLDSTVESVGADSDISDTIGDVTGGDIGDVTGGAVGDVTSGDVTGNQGDAMVGDIASFDDILNSLSAGNADVSDIGNISEIWLVDVQDIANFDADMLNDALSGNDVSGLQGQISENDVLSNALSGNAIDVSEIVAIDNQQDGSLIIYTYEE